MKEVWNGLYPVPHDDDDDDDDDDDEYAVQ